MTVGGATAAGPITLSLPAGAVKTADGIFNQASTSTDNTVEYVIPTPLTVSVATAAGQAEPSTSSALAFDIVFSEPVDGFEASDVTLSGTAPGAGAVLTGTGPAYVLTVNVTAPGTVILSVPAGVATSATWDLPNLASEPAQVTATYEIAPTTPTTPAAPAADLAATGAPHVPIGLPIGLLVTGGILAITATTRSRMVTNHSR